MSILLAAAAAALQPVAPCYGEEWLARSPVPFVGRDSAPRPGDPLGDVWEEEEVSCWQGTWFRRGKSKVFDAYWKNPSGERERATLQVWLNGRSIIVGRRHEAGKYCRYDGLVSPDWEWVEGEYACTWHPEPMHWRARIVRLPPRS